VGFSLLFLGLLGTVLPVLQGVLFFALGLFVLRHQYAWAHHGMEWLRRRWPQQVDSVEALEARLIAWFRRQGAKLRLGGR
jgi:uncharacterized membrane protein YbaN (DUF454 family)